MIETAVDTNFLSLDEPHQAFLRDMLRAWYGDFTRVATEASSIRNKMARIFALVFAKDFPTNWQSFFLDISSHVTVSPVAGDLFLRIMLAIDEEVVDREVERSTEITSRNSNLKDSMRMIAMPTICDAWFNIINTYNSTDPALVGTCLHTISLYVSWIDITLIANERFLNPIFRFLSSDVDVLREGACECATGLVNKGMSPSTKIQFLQSLQIIERVSAVKASLPPTGNEEYLLKLSVLVNSIGVSLIVAINR